MYYYESQQSWYYDFEYKDYINNGNKVVLSANALRHLKNIIPFGIGFITNSNSEPFSLNTFANKETLMLLLNEEDINLIEETIYNE